MLSKTLVSAIKNEIQGIGLIPLTSPLTSTSWNGNAYSDVSTPTEINLYDVFGVPKGARAIVVSMIARDSVAAVTVGLYFRIGPTSTYCNAIIVRPIGDDVLTENAGICPVSLDSDGKPRVFYTINASGTGTMDCWLRIWGYFLR